MSRKQIGQVGNQGPGGLACPNCGGTSFKAKRSLPAKVGTGVTFGVGAAVIPKRWVKRQTCGTVYKRG